MRYRKKKVLQASTAITHHVSCFGTKFYNKYIWFYMRIRWQTSRPSCWPKKISENIISRGIIYVWSRKTLTTCGLVVRWMLVMLEWFNMDFCCGEYLWGYMWTLPSSFSHFFILRRRAAMEAKSAEIEHFLGVWSEWIGKVNMASIIWLLTTNIIQRIITRKHGSESLILSPIACPKMWS
jgi:hypothetical protein